MDEKKDTLGVGGVVALPETTIKPLPILPVTIQVGGAQLRLMGDGSWEGDGKAFVDAVGKAEDYSHGDAAALIWLIANAVRRDLGEG